VIRRLGLVGLAAAMVTSAGCPGCPEYDVANPLRPTQITRWDFDMGSQGGGVLRFHANGPANGDQDGECLTAVCHTLVEDKSVLDLTASASSGFRFRRWIDDPVHRLPCDGDLSTQASTLHVSVIRAGACFAVFEATDAGTPTAPGLR
jgi:hypothetical protein